MSSVFIVALMALAPTVSPAVLGNETSADCSVDAGNPAPLFSGISVESVTITCYDNGIQTVSTAHAVQVELDTPGLGFVTSPESSGSLPLTLPTDFLSQTGSQVAFNANLFTVCCTMTPPTAGEAITDLRGLEISGGALVTPPGHNPPPDAPPYPFSISLVVDGGSVSIMPSNEIAETAEVAVSGSHLLVQSGGNVAPDDTQPTDFFGPTARTLVGLTPGNASLWIVAVDFTENSAGLTLPQSAELMIALGTTIALNLDGGGSTSLAVEGEDGTPQLLNTPKDFTDGCTFPANGGCERYVGASFGITAPALDNRLPVPPAEDR